MANRVGTTGCYLRLGNHLAFVVQFIQQYNIIHHSLLKPPKGNHKHSRHIREMHKGSF